MHAITSSVEKPGALVLFFAMLATKFSGNTFFGLPGQSYRVGLMAVTLIPLYHRHLARLSDLRPTTLCFVEKI